MATDEPEIALLQLLATPKVGKVRAARTLEWCRRQGIQLEDFVAAPQPVAGILTGEMASSLRSSRSLAIDLMDRLNHQRIHLTYVSGEGYPKRLSEALGLQAPVLLCVQGNAAVLDRPTVGFCGSRKASERGILAARDCAAQLAEDGINVVSGYAAGVDLSAHGAALRAGGTTAVVLAEGILRFRIKQELCEVWDWERVAVVSEFLPSAIWSVGNAMQRNGSICGLSSAMVLIEARTTGGSIEAGRTCLRLGLPLFVSQYEGEPESADGNRELLKQGARPLYRSRATGLANLKGLVAIARGQAHVPAQSLAAYRA